MLRKATEKDIDNIIDIIEDAKIFMRDCGINQWQDGYPNREVILNDIKNEESYVMVKDNEIVATVMIGFDGEKTYEKIYEGEWISNGTYATIHRIATSAKVKGKGIAKELIEEIKNISLEKGIFSIKIDTHEDNKIMKRLLNSTGFKYCGIIHLQDGAPRIAFEKNFEI